MGIGSIPLFEAMARRMAWLTQRQTVLAENVANANTPGYVPRDLKEPSFRQLVQGTSSNVHLVATHPDDIQPKSDSPFQVVTEDPSATSLDGNGVSLEAQMMKVSTNAADYALTTTLYQKNISMIKMVLGGG